jgi:hypothetical protein
LAWLDLVVRKFDGALDGCEKVENGTKQVSFKVREDRGWVH